MWCQGINILLNNSGKLSSLQLCSQCYASATHEFMRVWFMMRIISNIYTMIINFMMYHGLPDTLVSRHFGIKPFPCHCRSVQRHFVSRDTSVLMPNWSGHFGPSTEMSGDTLASVLMPETLWHWLFLDDKMNTEVRSVDNKSQLKYLTQLLFAYSLY